jgi:type IV secretory pathway VirB2 component (pilin)
MSPLLYRTQPYGWVLFFSVLFSVLLFGVDMAEAATPIAKLNPFAEKVRGGSQSIAYALAAVAAIGVSAMAFFKRFSWRWVFSLLGGLAAVAAVPLIIEFVTGFY